MKVDQIPWQVFNTIADTPRDELEANHLGGKRIIAPLNDLDGWAVFTEHPELQCSSCKLFPNIKLALKDCWPTCYVQVGPYCTGWDEAQNGSKRELRASFFARNPSPRFEQREERWISRVRVGFEALNTRALPMELPVEPDFLE